MCGKECIRHSTADADGIRSLDQRLKDSELVRYFRTAKKTNEGAFGFEDAGKGIELFREQLARSRDAHVRNHACGRRVGAVRRPEGVIHIHVRQSGKGRCELRVVFGFRFVEAEVFEQKDFAVGKRFDRFFSRHANAVRSEVDLGLEVASEGFCDDA